MSKRFQAVLLGLVATVTVFSSAAATCTMTELGTAVVSEVLDGRTLRLQDGREVVLADIVTPLDPPPAPNADTTAVSPGWQQRAKAALAAQVTGKTVILKTVQRRLDRYGRLSAYPMILDQARAGEAASVDAAVQGVMVKAGLAQLSVRLADPSCADGLRRAERDAMARRIGIWSDPVYAVKNAMQPASVLAALGRLAVVEGQVVSVRPSGGTIYVNFGRRWSEDFTVTIAKRNERMMVSAGKTPKSFENRRVRVRGYVGERGGPWIEVTSPEQIEIVGSK